MKTPSARQLVRTGTLAARLFAGAVATLLASQFAHAATWSGTSGVLWNDSSNWDTLPVSNNSLIFGTVGGGGPLLNNDLTSGSFNVAGITFNSGAGAFVIGDGTAAANAGNTFVLTGNVTNNSTSLQTINTPFSMTAVRTFTTSASGGDMLLGGNISGSGGGITKSGLGTLTLSGTNTFNGGLSVSGGGTLKVTGDSPLASNALTLGTANVSPGTFIYDNVGATGAVSLTLASVAVNAGDQTVRLTRTAAQDAFLTINAVTGATNEDGREINYVVDGAGVSNGVNAKIIIADQAAFRISTDANCSFFNGGDFAVYDAGPDFSHATPLDGFVRGINYGVDANSATSAGTTFTNTHHQEITGSISGQGSVTLGTATAANNGTLKIAGASDLTMNTGAVLTIDNANDTGSKGILKTGGGTSIISGGGSVIQNQKNGVIRVDGPTDVLNFAMQYNFAGSQRYMKSGEGTLIWSSGTVVPTGTLWHNGGVVEIGGSATYTMASGTYMQTGTLLKHSSSSLTSSIAGAISGFGAVTVSAGKLTLTGANTYTGATTISGGTLQLGSGGTTGALAAGSALTNDGTLVFNRSDTLTQGTHFASVIAGSGSLTKDGTGTLVLTGANTLGATVANQGLLQLSPSGTNTMVVNTISSGGGVVDFNPGSGAVQTTTGNDASGIIGVWATYGSSDWAVGSSDGITLTTVTAATYTNTSDALNNPTLYAGKNMNVNSDQAPTNLIAPNSLRFNSAAPYTLTLQGANSIASGGILVGSTVGNNLSKITGGTLATGTELIVNQNNILNNLEIGSTITGGGMLSKWGAGTLVLSGANNYTGQTNLYAGTTQFAGTMAAGSVVAINGAAVAQMGAATGLPADASVTFGAGSAGKLQLNGNNLTLAGLNTNATLGTPIVESGSATAGTDILTVTNGTGATSTFAGTLRNGSTRLLGLAKSGAGTLALSGTANTYTGKTVIDGGTLAFYNDGSLGTNPGAAQADHITINNGGTLREMSGQGNTTFGTNRGITLGSGVQTIRHNGNGWFRIDGAISGSGGLDVSSDSGNDLRLGGINTYTGETRLYANVGMFNARCLEGTTLDYSTAYGGQLNYLTSSGFTAVTFGGLKGNKDLAIGAVALSIGNNNSSTAYSGVLSSTTAGNALNKIGTGTLTLGGNNSYSGPTNVNVGTLVINGTGTGTNTGAVTVALDARLGGNGSTPAAVTIQSGGKFLVDISDWTGLAGAGFSDLSVGALDLTGATWVLNISSATAYANFSDTTTTFPFLTATGGITGFNAGNVSFSAAGFPGGGSWSVQQSLDGFTLELVYTGTGATSPYDDWAAIKGLTALNKAANLDPDNDGHNNLAEFAFNGDPLSGSDNGQVYVLQADSDADTPDTDKELILTLAVRKTTAAFTAGAPATATSVADGISYAIEGSLDLSGFDATVTPVGYVDPGVALSDATHYEFRSFSLSGSNGLPTKGFLRAKAVKP